MSWIEDELSSIAAANRLREPLHLSSAPGPLVVVEGREYVHLCSNNYLGLASDKRVADAAAEAIRRFGTGAGASRLVTGGSSLHRLLEERLAALHGTDDCVVFASGYAANTGVVPVLASEDDAIFSDELNHASMVDACRLSRAAVHVYRHADVAHLDDLLRSTSSRRKLVVTDTVFSMDGDCAPLVEIADACERSGAMLYVDEAHATGVLGASGAGASEAAGVRADAVMGTLSKALGSAGGFVCGSRSLCALLRNRARTFVFDTAPPPASIAAALAALDIVASEPERRDRVRALAQRLASSLRAKGFDVPQPAAAVVPLVLGSEKAALKAAATLREAGVLALAIRPPSVPDGTSRIRFTAMATHTEEQIDRVSRTQ